MTATFNMHNLPFSVLEPHEQETLLSSIRYAEFAAGDVLLEVGSTPEGIFVVYSGRVAETEPEHGGNDAGVEVYMYYEKEEYFGSWSLFNGVAIHRFSAIEPTACHIIPTQTLYALIDSNPNFADFFQQNLRAKREIVAQQAPNQDMAEFMLARIQETVIREPLIVPEGTSIEQATRMMRESKADCMLAQKDGRYGMVTGTDLLDAVILQHLPLATDISEIASYRLISIRPDDYLFNALIIMTQQRIERVVVMDGSKQLRGIVELTDVLSYFSSHSHVIGLRVERAQTVAELREASLGLLDLIKALISSGVKIRFMMELLSVMNSRILSKLFDLIIPAEMHPHVCLIVMGSEGRGEQIMKTDQDNGIIYRDGLDWPEMHATLRQFSETLVSFGFPPCPGNIMVSNPEWVNSVKGWAEKLTRWSQNCNTATMMNLAIAADSKPVAGNIALFKVARNTFFRRISDNDMFFAHFVRPAIDFETPLSFFGRLTGVSIDIKKAGIFPIVQGVRTIALEHKIAETNTFVRLEKLAEQRIIDREMASNLAEVMSFFVQIRLQQQVARVTESGQMHDEIPNEIDFKRLNKFERELLRDSLQVVKDFKRSLANRYRLNF